MPRRSAANAETKDIELLAQVVGRLAHAQGYVVGMRGGVLYADLPTGQVSWPIDNAIGHWPPYKRSENADQTQESRLTRYVERGDL